MTHIQKIESENRKLKAENSRLKELAAKNMVKKQILLRILVIPIIAILGLITHIVLWLKFIWQYILYGGEMITYDKNTRLMIFDVWNELKNKQI